MIMKDNFDPHPQSPKLNTVPISRYRFFQQLQPINLLKKITHNSFTGCLQVFSESSAWSIYMDRGKLIYAGYSEEMFEPLYRNLKQLSKHISTLPRGINEQVRMIFEKNIENQSIPNPDYLAICWLVNQQYISHLQAAILIEHLALEVLGSLLDLKYGSYELIHHSFLDNLPKFCHLSLRTLVEQCQAGVKVNFQDFDFATDNQTQIVQKYQQLFNTSNYQNNIQPEQYFPSQQKKKCSIFCIDNDRTILNDITDFLDDQIFDVIKFTNSSQALMEILRVEPDIILLNIEMPNLDGYEVCGLLRKHINYQHIPVILMTERMGLRDRAKAKFVKANSYLEKPFSQGDLLKIIFHHIV
jgi:two-component system, chemotaxis family, response regulator PixG